MQRFPIQQSEFFKEYHQASNMFIHGDFLIAPHAKHSRTYFIKHYMRFSENVKLWYNNINFVIVTFLMQRCISVLSGLCSNKTLHLTRQYAVSLRCTLYCRSDELSRYAFKRLKEVGV